MTEKCCANCKHWKRCEFDWEGDAIGFRKCVAVRQRWSITDEATERLGFDRRLHYDDDPAGAFATARREALQDSLAYVQDGSEYRAELITAPDFYCALFDTEEGK